MLRSIETARSRSFSKSVLIFFYLVIMLWVAIATGRVGLSYWLQDVAAKNKSVSHADKAIGLDSENPDAYKARGMLLLNQERYSEAARDFQEALKLRPEDYLLWLRFGYSSYKAGNSEIALRAYERATILAPFYAQPRWYIGRLWLKRGNPDEAFRQLSKSAAFNTDLLPQVLHLARENFIDDPVAIQSAIEPSTPTARLELARYFIKHGFETKEMRSFLTSDELSESNRDALVEQLIAAKKFDLAFETWASGSPEGYKGSVSADAQTYQNNGFENEINSGERGFSWQFARNSQELKIAVDKRKPYSGASSLLIDFSGNRVASGFVVSQIVLVEPDKHYQLQVAVRTQDLVTGALPVATAKDANTGELLARTAPFSQSTNDWRQYSASLTTASNTRAVIVGIERLPCGSGPCPIFGKVWIDDFHLANP